MDADPTKTTNVLPFPPKKQREPLPDGTLVMNHVKGRWRVPEVERLRAAADTKRIEIEQAGKERL